MSLDVGIVCGECDWLNPREQDLCASCGAGLALGPPVEGRASVVPAGDPLSADAGTEPPGGEAGPEREEEADLASLVDAAEQAFEVLLRTAAEPEEELIGIGDGGADEDEVIERFTDAGLVEDLEELEELEEISEEEAARLSRRPPRPRFDSWRSLDDSAIKKAAESSGVILVRPKNIGPPGGADKEERRMDQARHYICKSCYSPIPGGHKFCGKCGAPTNFTEESTTTQYFGAMQVPGKAKLILIRGEGLDGISYHLNSTEHVAGRQQGAILFPDDAWLSPRHANFFYRDNKLFVRDEDSVNGVYFRVADSAPVSAGAMFLAGEQLFRIESAVPVAEGPEADGTYFYASPSKAWTFKVSQILRGGLTGMTVHDDGGQLTIGREDCHMNFPTDVYLDGRHAKVQVEGGQITLSDLGTMNGTFLRVQKEKVLAHGDYVFLGKQLLRVEVTP